MAGYKKFSEGWRFDATERTTPKTLATLATLAAPESDFSSPASGASAFEFWPFTPAKVAKVAKVEDGTGCNVGGIELPAAERYRKTFALLQVKPPALVDVARWQQCVADGSKFLAVWGEQAEALGWTSADLFGLHTPPERPHPSYSRLSRYDATGLCWLLQGRRVTALTADTAAIENLATGGITVYRKHNKPALGPLGDSLEDFDDERRV